ncbi:MAG: Ig-like domain-containing protein [Bacteroidaceae bacterium]|nr:Ig-like domain-containing protein [Bacteroidaceae bacterium]
MAKTNKGKDGDAFFKSVSVGDTEVTFTLADGVTTFTLPLMDTFKKVRDRVQSIVFIPENIDGMMTLQNGVATTVRYRVMPVEVATALATSYASTLSFIGEEVAVTRAATSAALAISGVADEGSGRLAVTVTASGMDADKGYAFALLMNDGTSMYSTAYTSVFFAIPPTKIGIAANGVTAGSGQVEVGTSIQLFALMVPTTTNMKQVTWSSSDAAVAKVDADGMLTAISDGTAVITVRSNADTSVAKSITVTVKEGALSLNTEELVSQSEAE